MRPAAPAIAAGAAAAHAVRFGTHETQRSRITGGARRARFHSRRPAAAGAVGTGRAAGLRAMWGTLVGRLVGLVSATSRTACPSTADGQRLRGRRLGCNKHVAGAAGRRRGPGVGVGVGYARETGMYRGVSESHIRGRSRPSPARRSRSGPTGRRRSRGPSTCRP